MIVIRRTIVLPDPIVRQITHLRDWNCGKHAYGFPGVYVFWIGDECVYVGKATESVGKRVGAHLWNDPPAWGARPTSDRHEEMKARVRGAAVEGRLRVELYKVDFPNEAEGDVISAFCPTMNASTRVGHGGCTMNHDPVECEPRITIERAQV